MSYSWVFSASQINSYTLCPRKWAWQKIDRALEKPSASRILGINIHKILELWGRDGKLIETDTAAGKIARAGLHLLPDPKTPGVELEKKFTIELGGHAFLGLKDIEVLSLPVPLVIDYKTTKDFKWAMTPESFPQDPQACLYAADAMFRTQKKECDVKWVYFKTQGTPRAKEVHLRMVWDGIEPTLNKCVTLASEMLEVLNSGAKALDLPYNPSACEAFGGCDFKDKCNLTDRERMRAVMTQGTVQDFIREYKERMAGAINPPPMPATYEEEMPPEPVLMPDGTWALPDEARAPDTMRAPAVTAEEAAATEPDPKEGKLAALQSYREQQDSKIEAPPKKPAKAKAKKEATPFEVLPDKKLMLISCLRQMVANGKFAQELLKLAGEE